MVEKLRIFNQVVGIVGFVVDVVLRNRIDLYLVARQLQANGFDKSILSTASRTVSSMVGNASSGAALVTAIIFPDCRAIICGVTARIRYISGCTRVSKS